MAQQKNVIYIYIRNNYLLTSSGTEFKITFFKNFILCKQKSGINSGTG